MTAAQWAERLRKSALAEAVYGSSDNTLCEEISLAECRELASLLEAAEEIARALDELRVLTEGIVAQRGPLGDKTVDRIMRRAADALAAWRGRK